MLTSVKTSTSNEQNAFDNDCEEAIFILNNKEFPADKKTTTKNNPHV